MRIAPTLLALGLLCPAAFAQSPPCKEFTNAQGKRETRCSWEDFDADKPFAGVHRTKSGSKQFRKCVRYLEKLHGGKAAGRAPKCNNMMKCEMAARKPGPFDAAGCLRSASWDGRSGTARGRATGPSRGAKPAIPRVSQAEKAYRAADAPLRKRCLDGDKAACRAREELLQREQMREALELCEKRQRGCVKAKRLVQQVCGDDATCAGRKRWARIEADRARRSRKSQIERAKRKRAAQGRKGGSKSGSKAPAKAGNGPLVALDPGARPWTKALYRDGDRLLPGTFRDTKAKQPGHARMRVADKQTIEVPLAGVYVNDWTVGSAVECRATGDDAYTPGVIRMMSGYDIELDGSRVASYWDCRDPRPVP